MSRFATARHLGAAVLACIGVCRATPALAEDAGGPSPLDLTAGLRALHRTFTYHDTHAQLYPNAGHNTLLTFEQPLAPSAFLQANLYPFALSSRGPEANVGLLASYETGFATRTVFRENTPRQQTLTSHSSELLLGVRGRMPLGQHELGLSAAYGQQRYLLSGDDSSPLVPDVTYEFARLASEATFRFDTLTLGLHLGTRLVGDTGGLQRDWFPSTRTQSVEAGVLLGCGITSGVELVGGFDLVRYAFDFNPIPNNADPTYVAGGGVDQYTSGWIGLRFRLENHAPQ